MFRKVEPEGGAKTAVRISIDGVELIVEEGEPIAAVLLRLAPFTNRTTPVSGAARAPYCMMGACFECLVEIDGETSKRACVERAREGMAIARQLSRPDPFKEFAL